MKTEFCIWSQFYNTKEPEEAILEFEKDGLGYIELSSEHITALLERKGELSEIGADFANFCLQHGVKIRQAHLIFPSNIATDKSVTELLDKQLILLSAMGVKAAVLHGDEMEECDISYKEKLDRNAEALIPIARSAERVGITVCIENMRKIFASIDEILYVIEKIGSPALGVCLDTGHLNITKTSTQREFILKAGNRLKALHIANNDGKTDQHFAPFTGGISMDFFEVVDALRDIGYEGMFNHEIGGESGNCPVPVKHIKYHGIKAGYDYLMDNLK